MSDSMMYIIWAVAIVGFGVLEAVTVQLVSIWFVIGSVAGLVAALLGAPIYLQVIICIAVSVLALLVTRPLVRKKLQTKVQPTNADRVIGQTAVVVEEINNIAQTGTVKFDGKVWTARSCDDKILPPNSLVAVEKIDGVKLIVKQN
ncbi:NfeD family protein [uncultured Eubacterium sp.]|uniref:NfeD family protein n=1 Tax=uncultured Eubacterium sp. TaxID=165185 RepID=UPI0025869D81|nr:NfeD family protein [uncultured Eubacterium sp.]